MTKAKILNKTATTTLILLLLLSMVGIINIAFVSAHPNTEGINLVPSKGVAGSLITVYGSGFSPNETVRTYFGATLVNTTSAAPNGTLYATFTVPAVSPGSYDVTSIGLTSGKSFIATFTVPTISITLTPTWGPPGKQVNVGGEGFTRIGLVKIYFDNAYQTAASADEFGNIKVNFAVPTTTLPGTHTVKANDAATGNNATAIFTVPTPTLTSLSPTCGPPGKSVLVTGGNFTIGGKVGIYFGTTFAGNLTADGEGGISGSVYVPSLVPGTYNVRGKDWSNGAWSTQLTFIVPSPSLTLDPNWGPPGKSIMVTGGNFTINGKIGIYFDGRFINNATATAEGAITYTLTVPIKLPGSYLVSAKDWSTGYTVTKPFTVPTPTIALSPEGGPPGTEVTVTGGNFTVTSEVRIYFDAISMINVTTTSDGSIPAGTQFKVPLDATIGAHIVRAYDSATTYTATATFTLGPVISISPTSGPPATNVTVTGSGFTANQTVQIYFDTTLVETVNASSTGTISTWFLVPDATAGTHNVKAYDVYTATWTPAKTFTIPSPTITLSLTEGYPGDSITITGANFKLNATVTIYFAGAQWGATVTTSAASGSFTATRIVPDRLAGNYTVSATDGVNIATAWFVVKSTAGGIEEVITKLVEIELKLDQHGSFWNFTNNWFTSISNKLGTFMGSDTVASLLYDIKTSVSAINWTDIAIIKSYVIDIEAKLDNSTYGLAAIKTAVDAINFTAIDNKLGSFAGTDTVASLLYDIKASVQNITVTVDFTPVLEAISGLDAKIGNFTGTDTVASLLYDIKTSVGAINWTDITAIKAKIDTINWADIGTIKDTTRLSIDYLWGLQNHPLWGLRTKIVPMLESIKNATQFTAGTYSEIMPNSTAPVNLGKSSKVTLTVRAKDDATAGFVIKVYIYDGNAWQPLAFSVPGIAGEDCAATVEFTTGADGRFYFEITGANFTAFIYSAESAP